MSSSAQESARDAAIQPGLIDAAKTIDSLTRILTDMAVACDDQGVAEAVAAAKTAIALYRE